MSNPAISFEFFPPRSPVQQRRFWSTLGCLQTLNPEYVSLTWGALGTSSEASVDLLEGLMVDAQVPVAAHITCVGHTDQSIRSAISRLEALGVTRFVALRGDQPKEPEASGNAHDKPATTTEPEMLQHASQLVKILAEDPNRDISVAAYPELHPESGNSKDDLHWLKHKLDQGAKRAITQFFFSAETFLRFRDKAVAAGITQELVPGILPIHDIGKVQEFSGKCGTDVPDSLVKRFAAATDAQSAQNCAVEQCVELIDTLHREGVGSFHLYTLNQSSLSYQICKELNGESQNIKSVAAA